jgi:hypothetical protein
MEAIYAEDFSSDPGYTIYKSSNDQESVLEWDDEQENYFLKTVDESGGGNWEVWAASPLFPETSSQESFTVSFRINPVEPDWGNYPGLRFAKEEGGLPDFNAPWAFRMDCRDSINCSPSSEETNSRFRLDMSGADDFFLSPRIPTIDEWYEVTVEYEASNETADIVILRSDGSIFAEASDLPLMEAGTSFDQVVLGHGSSSPPEYGDKARLRVDDIMIQGGTDGLPKPTSLSATSGDGLVDLTWETSGTSSLAGYNVYRDTSSFSDPDNATKVNGSPVTDTSFTDAEVSNGTTYYYRVAAADSAGNESTLSNEGSATPTAGACPLAWSLGVTGSDTASDSLSVTFGQSPAATAGIDAECGEEEQPPLPPSEVFDLRFTGTDLPGVDLGEGLVRDIRPTDQPTPESESAPATWRLEVQSSSYPVTLAWDNAALADSLPDVPVRLVDVVTGGNLVDVDMKSAGSVTVENSSVTALEIRLDRALTREVPIAAGWNLLSVPLEAEDPSFGSVLPPCESGFFFEPDAGYNGISEGEAVPVGRGLFANCSAGTAQVTGEALAPTIEVAEGWNIIGPLADSIGVNAITSDPAGIVQSNFFGFDPASGYQGVSTLSPGAGYWVKVGEAGTLNLSGSGEGTAVATKALAATQSTMNAARKEAVELRLTDASGREATLRLASGLTEAQRKRSALPPVPPSGIFDVRFEDGRSVAKADGDDLHAIRAQGLEAPVTVRLAGAEEGQSVQIRHAGHETRLTAERPSAELSTTDGLAVGLQSAPDEFALKKTYPNPASGQATVEYALPEQAEVTIGVYDVLGRRVATLVDSPEQAGRYTVRLNAGQMPSGMYFVRMQAEGFRQTRRLTVVR